MWKALLVGVVLLMMAARHTSRLAAQSGIAEAGAPASPVAMPRVRPNDSPLVAALLREAVQRSARFRQLVRVIDASDGIVYIEEGACGHHVRACLAFSVRLAGPNRILRVVIDPRRNHDDLLAAMGHELQHAIEVLSNRHVTDYQSLYSFYDRIAPTDKDRFETLAAVNAGMEIRAELRRTH